MKKRFTFLIAAIVLLTMIVPTGEVWGQTIANPYTITLSSSLKINNSNTGTTSGNVTWYGDDEGGATIQNTYSSDYSGQQFGTGSTQGSVEISTSSFGTATITSVVVECQTGTKGGGTVNVMIGSSDYGTQNMQVPSSTGLDPGTLTFPSSGTGSSSGTLTITMTQTKKKAMYLHSITVNYSTGYSVTYTPGTGNTASNVVDNNISGSYTVRYNNGQNGNPNFSKTGHTFKCWNNGTNDVNEGANITVSGNVTLAAQWNPIEYTITYKPGFETSQPDVEDTKYYGEDYEIADNVFDAPSAAHSFTGWKDSNNNDWVVGASYTANAPLTLTAQWTTATMYTVTYNCNGGESGCPSNASFESGTQITLPAAPTYTDHTFDGWLDNAATPVKHDAGSSYTVTGNVTFTAQWLENLTDPTFTVTGVSNGTANTYYVIANITIDQEEDANVYYTIDGSNPASSATKIEYDGPFDVTESCTIKAVAIFEGFGNSAITEQAITIVQPNEATFTYGVYSESFGSSLGLWYAYSVSGNYKWAQGTPANNYTGANINGYSENANNEDWLISPKMTVLNGKLDVSFKTAARYSGAAMVVKYSTDYNGYGNPNNYTWTDMSPSLSTNTNNTFSGWTDGKATISGLSDNANVYVAFKYTSSYHSAKQYVIKDFTANQYYSVLYNPGEGSGTMTDPDLYAVGSEVTALECTFTAPSNKVFSNWKVEVDDEDPEYVNGDETFTMGAVVTLTAQWVEPAQIITVTYSENGATHSETVTEGDEVTLVEPTNAAPANMTFAGWAENPITKFSESAPAYVTEYEAVASKTFYAVYEYNCPTGGITKGWKKVTDATTLAENDKLILANEEYGKVALGIGAGNAYLSAGDAVFNNGIITTNNENVVEFTLYGSSSAWTLKNGNKVLTTSAAKNMAWDGSGNGVASTWTIGITNGDATITSSTTSYGSIKYNSQYPRFLNYASGQQVIQLYRYEDVAATKSYYVTSVTELAEATTIAVSTTTTLDHNVTINTNGYTINGTLDANGYLIANKTASNIVVNDGGQLKASNAVKATVKKNITQKWVPASGIGWYTISTPTGLTGFSDVANLKPMDGDNRLYDIYRYKESTMTWENSVEAGFNNDIFEEGRGYLYRKGNTDALEFAGPVNIAASYVQDLSVTGETAIAGFALLGNPYSHNINLKHVTVNAGDNLDACYILSGEGAWGASIGNTADIAPCTGFLVQATEECKATIHKSQARDSKANADYIQFIVANDQYEDVTFALFDEGHGLNKINHRNSNIQQIYIPKDGESFAVATMADNTQSFNLNFKAMTMGQYTLSFKTKGEFNYLHVIDRMTGEDIDMILEGEYSFIGSPQDNEARFIVRLGYLPNYDNNGEDIFAYQNGSDVIVSGEGELQIFDVMGRMVSTQNVSGTEKISVNAQGVYIFRLVGTEIKTQKIVVR